MTSKIVLATIITASFGAAAFAQEEPRFELTGTFGWTFSDGVSGGTTDAFGNAFARIDPADAFSWNLRGGLMVNDNVEIGALFGMQSSSLNITLGSTAASTFALGDETIYNYHGYFAYNFGEPGKVRPYVLIGLGATQFGGVAVNTANVPVPHDNTQREIGGSTKFSSIWAAGIKLYPSKNLGIRFEGRWTPTYIKSDATGWWCDPYWGCYTTGNAQYANQFELGGGIGFRF